MKIIYADNAATTKVMPEVFESMKPFFEEHFGNPSSLYSIGRFSKNVLEKSRKSIADCINAKPNEIFFTSGGTESDNWALKSCVKLNPGDHVITSKIEHHAILKSAKYLETREIKVTYLDVDKFGWVNPETLEKEINQSTKLVSIMTANNEIGTIEPISELSKICRKKNVKFHTDAVQAIGHIEIDVEKMGIDMLSSSAHKFGGPKGIGFLYIRNGIASSPLIHGGAQESNRRAGTENIPYIVGMAKALEISCSKMKSNRGHLLNLQKKLVDNILSIEETILTGHPTMRTPGSASFCFKGIEGESLLLHLDALGICGSSGSACTSGSLDPSHVLLAIGLPHEVAHGSLRLTLGPDNTMEDVDYIISVLPSVVKKLRLMSPVWEKMSK